ncbi:MAG: LCP family protein [Chloroflexia bacterium]
MRTILMRAALALLVLVILAVAVMGVRVNNFSRAVSGRSVFASDISDRAQKDGRFNLLVMGYGGGQHEGANLTDSILVYSVPLDGGPAVQIGVPRDLWVEAPVGSGNYRKVNAAYANALANDQSPTTAAGTASDAVGTALGIPIHGWMTVDFTGFQDLVSAVGGVSVNVQREFTARYPNDDDPNTPFAWTQIKFEQGPQQMDGRRAIAYARARYSANPVEGTDFGRAARQQRLVGAIKRKLLSPVGVVRSFTVMGAVQDEIRTNVGAGDLARLFRRGVDDERSVVLSTENVVNDVSDDGQAILLPRDNDWDALRAYVQDLAPHAAAAVR